MPLELDFLTFLAPDCDLLYDVAVDPEGAIWVAGRGTPVSRSRGFVAKLDPAGEVIFTRMLGTPIDSGSVSASCAFGLAIDDFGSAYVTGYTGDVDFDAQVIGSGGDTDMYVTKFDSSGRVEYAYRYGFGGGSTGTGLDIAVDAAGRAYVTGGCERCLEFPPSPGPGPERHLGRDSFVLALEKTGEIRYGRLLAGGYSAGRAIALFGDLAGDPDPIVGGWVMAGLFPSPTVVGRVGRSTDAFITRVADQGARLAWTTTIGDFGPSSTEDLAVAGDRIWMAGWSRASELPTTDGTLIMPSFDDLAGGPCPSAFVGQLDSGGQLRMLTTLSGEDYDVAYGITADADGGAWTTGFTGSSRFPVAREALQPRIVEATSWDSFVARFGASGSGASYATFFGAPFDDSARSVALSGDRILIAGEALTEAGWPGGSGGPAPTSGERTGYVAGFRGR
jgi:hypothetical protein